MQRHGILAAKFQVSESARPDPIQIDHVLAEGLAKAGLDVCAGVARKDQGVLDGSAKPEHFGSGVSRDLPLATANSEACRGPEVPLAELY